VAEGILIYGETQGKQLAGSTKELLGIGRRLADLANDKVFVLLIGEEEIAHCGKEAICFGADEVFLTEDKRLQHYQPELWLEISEALCNQINPAIVLMSHNALGADLAPRVAFRLKTSLTVDCIDVALDPETKLLQRTKPIYGGNALAVYRSPATPQIATIREKTFSPGEQDDSRKGTVVPFNPELDFSKTQIKIIEVIEEETPGIKLEDAEAIVCGGRGVGDSEGFAELEELAEMLGGAVAGTRPASEKGWIPPRLQVGLTGKKVSPKLYLAVGVSGAIQHIAGMVGSKCIVAINKDPEANIFNEAHYGAVGDYREILPAFKEKVKELLNRN
jgi:electron transfer flavoprotein alpha subunit